MFASNVYDNAPLGSLLRFFDGAYQPPVDDSVAFERWRRHNGLGLLVRKDPPFDKRHGATPGSVTIRLFRLNGRKAQQRNLQRTFQADCGLRFEIIERPSIGTFRLLLHINGNVELLDITADLAAAQQWQMAHREADVRIEEVSADERAADSIEGRSAPVRFAPARLRRTFRAGPS